LILAANAPVGALEPAVGVSNSAPDTLDHSGGLTADQHRSKDTILLAVDHKLGEGAAPEYEA
jgi:hypothetical protein